MTLLVDVFFCSLPTNYSYADSSYYQEIVREVVPQWICTLEYVPWIWAIFGSILVGLSGVLPLLVIPIDHNEKLMKSDDANKLKTLLSFAVGGLLGDVFLHSLPEIWSNSSSNYGSNSSSSGILILTGLIIFVTAEKIFNVMEKMGETHKIKKITVNNNTKGYPTDSKNSKRNMTGYLNLLANTMDNFTHGLSLGGAFLVSLKLGLLTTFAILVHEVPHEVGDFAILLKSGFTRWDATIFQILTAGGGLIGAMAAISFSGAATSLEARSSWILPFTAGTFLHIGLVIVLPDLLKEENPKESFKQLLALIAGISIMGLVTNMFE